MKRDVDCRLGEKGTNGVHWKERMRVFAKACFRRWDNSCCHFFHGTDGGLQSGSEGDTVVASLGMQEEYFECEYIVKL